MSKQSFSYDWFTTYFGDDYWDLVQSYQLTPKELAFLDTMLPDQGSVLDLCCGIGRLLIPLVEKGFDITGIELNHQSVQYVQQQLQQRNLTATIICQDIRILNYQFEFHAVLLMQSSFGYFSDWENEQLLRTIFHSLLPGGIVILDVANRDGMIKQFREKEWTVIRDKTYLIHHQYDFIRSTRKTSLTVIEGDQKREYEHLIRLYSVSELIYLLEKAGFRVNQVCGDFRMEEPSFHTRRIQLIAQKIEKGGV